MRVLIAHNRYRTAGGEERHIDLLERALRDAAVEVSRFEVRTPASLSSVARVRLGLTLAYRPAAAEAMSRAVETERPDVVHFHNLLPLLTPAACRAARRQGARVALTIHNYRFACPAGTLLRNGQIHTDCIDGSSLACGLRNARGNWPESIAYGVGIEIQRRLRLLHRWVDAFITPSYFVAELLARAGYPRDRIHTVYHATPIEEARPVGGDFVLYAGRLSPEKGIQTLLGAAKFLNDVPFAIAGDGPLRDALGIAKPTNVAYRGMLDPGDLSELRRAARFVVVPSECYEAQPFSALEAMAAGKAVIASRLGGLAEIIEHGRNGLLVPPGDPVALADAIRTAWHDEHLSRAMGVGALEYARSHFSISEQTTSLRRVYGSILAHVQEPSASESQARISDPQGSGAAGE